MRSAVKLWNSMALVLVFASSVGVGAGQFSREFHRTFTVSLAEPVSLQVDLLEGDLHIAYARDGEVSFSATGQDLSGPNRESLSNRLVVMQSGNRLEIRERPDARDQNLALIYRLDVPYRTKVHASVRHGKQTISGIMGPVNANLNVGNIEISYISLGVAAKSQAGNLNFDVVGGRIEAQTGQGKIACHRAPQGISAEAENGDISLAIVGSSAAVVKNGNGRIEVAAARGALLASTSAGVIHVKAVPHQDWQLSSDSGPIRVELPPAAAFDLDAATTSGQLMIGRDDVAKPKPGVRQFSQNVNTGGKRIELRSNAGDIVIE